MGEAGTDRGEKDELSKFLERFPKKVYHEPTDLDSDKRGVFFSVIGGITETESNLSSSSTTSSADIPPGRWYLHEKIKRAFVMFNNGCPHKGVFVQYWAQKNQTVECSLSTAGEPFVLDHLDPRHQEYRLWCIDEENVGDPDDQHAILPIMIDFPDVVVNLENHTNIPVVDKALECGFNSQIMMPVYCQSLCKTKCACVGVIECCLERSYLLKVFKELRSAIESVGLIVQSYLCLRPEPVPGLEAAKCEIKEALETVCKSNHLALAQVWIPHDVEHFPLEPFYPKEEEEKDPQLKLGKCMSKLCGYRLDDFSNEFSSMVKDYCDVSDVLPYQVGMDFVGKTLMTYESRFCYDIGELTSEESYRFLRLLSNKTQCSSLVICLRSTHTGKDVDYAFEFLWPKHRNYFLLLQSLFIMLKRYLPSFTFACGAQLDDAFRIEVVENSLRIPGGFFQIFEQPKASEKVSTDAVLFAGISEGKGVKRKLDELPESEGEGEGEGEVQTTEGNG